MIELFDHGGCKGPALKFTSASELGPYLLSLARGMPGGMPRIYRLWRAEGTGTELYVGLGGPHAVAQFWDAEKERASFDAMAPQISASGSVDFLLGGTPTPMPPEYWLKPEDAVRVATYFLETGERHPDYKWRPG